MDEERIGALKKTAEIYRALFAKRCSETTQIKAWAEEAVRRAEQREHMLSQYSQNRDYTVLGTDESNRLRCEEGDKFGLMLRDHDDPVVQKLLRYKKSINEDDIKSYCKVLDMLEAIGKRKMDKATYTALLDGTHPIYHQARNLGVEIKPGIIDKCHR